MEVEDVIRARAKRLFIRRVANAFLVVVAIFGVFVAASIFLQRPLAPSALSARIQLNQVRFEKSADGKTWRSICFCGRNVVDSEIPQHVKDAVVAIEDRRFYLHNGIDLIGIGRALVDNVLRRLTGRTSVQGASTLTQQLVKFALLTDEQTAIRKLQEVQIAFQLEGRLSKDTILTTYLNRAVFTHRKGQPVVGIEYAARVFFGKHTQDLNLFEAAMLAGMLKNPRAYDPQRNKDASLARTKIVLAAMIDAGYITRAEADHALDIGARPGKIEPIDFESRFFTDMLKTELRLLYPDIAIDDNLRVFVAFDPVAQYFAEHAIRTARTDSGERRLDGALVSLDMDGRIVALAGGSNYLTNKNNFATRLWRQPASTFKLFPYLVAIEHGVKPDTLVNGLALPDQTWGRNLDGYYPEWISLTDAFARSINSVSRRLTVQYGPPEIAATARRLGVTAPLRENEELALGISEVSLLEMTAAYGSVVDGGTLMQAHTIVAIADSTGILLEAENIGTSRVVDPAVAGQMRQLLRSVVAEGTGRSANYSQTVVGKTGTGPEGQDAWFIGSDGTYVTGLWTGRIDRRGIAGWSGQKVAKVWGSYHANLAKRAPKRGSTGDTLIGGM